jgi:hypothetical protein
MQVSKLNFQIYKMSSYLRFNPRINLIRSIERWIGRQNISVVDTFYHTIVPLYRMSVYKL